MCVGVYVGVVGDLLGETLASSASGHVMWLYLACKLRYKAGKHIWRLLVTTMLCWPQLHCH